MKRKFLSLILTAAILCAFAPVMSAQAAISINIGDYVQMGTYYGEPILWRCVDIDDNGPLMLSDKIICLKPYDAGGETNTATGSHGKTTGRLTYGSNYWADSNIRSWLNSDADAGNVTWLCGNPPDSDHVYYNSYDNEAGFLTNFSQLELNSVKDVTQKSILSIFDKGLDTTGADAYHTYNSDIADVLQNYDSCYAESVTDKMFLLDVKQANAVYNNSSVLGDNYYIGEPTKQCVANSEYADTGFAVGEKWSYWLRSPYAYGSPYYGDYGNLVRDIRSDGSVYYNGAYTGNSGVRPAFYLDTESSSFIFGSGTESDPYAAEKYSYEITALSVEDESGATLSEIDPGEGFVVNVEVTEKTERNSKDCLIVAVYGTDGALLDVNYAKCDFAAGEPLNIGLNISPQTEDIGTIKASIWDGLSSMTPLAVSKSVSIEYK